jgi:hypothetical protein
MKIKKCTGCDTTNENPLQYGVQACCPDSNYVEMTAVEWLIENYWPLKRGLEIGIFDTLKVVEQAKEMQKQQHSDTWKDGMLSDNGYFGDFEEYYYETFKK